MKRFVVLGFYLLIGVFLATANVTATGSWQFWAIMLSVVVIDVVSYARGMDKG